MLDSYIQTICGHDHVLSHWTSRYTWLCFNVFDFCIISCHHWTPPPAHMKQDSKARLVILISRIPVSSWIGIEQGSNLAEERVVWQFGRSSIPGDFWHAEPSCVGMLILTNQMLSSRLEASRLWPHLALCSLLHHRITVPFHVYGISYACSKALPALRRMVGTPLPLPNTREPIVLPPLQWPQCFTTSKCDGNGVSGPLKIRSSIPSRNWPSPISMAESWWEKDEYALNTSWFYRHFPHQNWPSIWNPSPPARGNLQGAAAGTLYCNCGCLRSATFRWTTWVYPEPQILVYD